MANAVSAKLSELLVQPAKVKSLSNWNKTTASLMALSVKKGIIGVAISRHPRSFNSNEGGILLPKHQQFQWGKDINTPCGRSNSRLDIEIAHALAHQLSAVVQENNVCAFLVDWPISSRGRMGESCGTVLFTLDKLLHCDCGTDTSLPSPNTTLISKKRPFALVNYNKIDKNNIEDRWGRVVNFSQQHEMQNRNSNTVYSSKRAMHASENHKEEESGKKISSEAEVAVNILQQFIHEQWPNEHYGDEKDNGGSSCGHHEVPHSSFDYYDGDFIDDFEGYDTNIYV